MRTRTFVLIGIGLTLLSSLFLSLGQMYLLYKGEIPDWIDFIRRYAWRPGLKIWQSTFFGLPNSMFDSTIGWFLLLLPGVVLLAIFHPFRKPQKVVLGVLVLLTIMHLSWLLQGCGPESTASDWCYVPTLLHLGFSVLSLFLAVPLWLAVREEHRLAKEEGRQ